MSAAFLVDEARSFATIPNSSYVTRDGRGTYLLTGDRMTFTRGPLKGVSFMRESANRLRLVENDESEGRLICNRRAHRGEAAVSGRSAADTG